MRALLLLCVVLSACGGGGGGATAPTVLPPPPSPNLTAEVYDRWLDAYEQELVAYAATEDNRNRNMGAQWGTSAHYQYFVQDALMHVGFFTDDARAILADVESRGTVNRATASDWVEDFRMPFRDHLLDRFADLRSHSPGVDESFYTRYRNDLINGVNERFDQLQLDV